MHDLNQSINSWRQTLSQKGACSTDEMQELECHLREQVTALLGVGLSEQEAFSVAVSRIGVPDQLCAEYAKASPMRLWRHRTWQLLLAAPAVAAGAFVAVYLLPRIHREWEKAGIGGNLQWLIDTPALIFDSLFRYGHFALLALVAAMVFFDSRRKNWSRLSYLPFSVIAFSVNFVVLVAITITCTAFAWVVVSMP